MYLSLLTKTCYEYDTLGRTSRIYTNQGMEVRYGYDCLNRIETIQYGNGIKTQYQYDTEGNVGRLETKLGETTLLAFQYAYDGNGNRLSKVGKQALVDGTESYLELSYQYNVRGQLLKEKRNENVCCYTYDATGNRLSKESKEGKYSYHYNKKNQLVLEESIFGKKEFTYSQQGSVLEEKASIGIRRFFYNSKNQQIRVEQADGQIQENHYDAEGLRYEMRENEKRFQFVYHKGELLYEHGNHEQTSYHLGAGIEAFQRNQQIYYYHQDEQFSTTFITDVSGSIQNHYQYDAFGKELKKEEQLLNRIRYTGQQYDNLTEQYYLRARYYNPILGRFMQEDVYQGDGLNLYAYCDSNPVMYYDPSGYQTTSNVSSCVTSANGGDGSNTVNPNALKYNGNGTWTSNAGLIYGQGSIHGNRVKHVLAHTQPDPSKPRHTVFNVDRSNVIGLVDEAWNKKGSPLPNDPGVYVVDMGRVIGTNGETKIRIVVRPNTNNIISIYPQ